ncbi:MAG: glycoside hydrolase family 16 protein [Verrucomicrobiae bacterium]|nr:glycoside hydrolase family 16 protein [Verrucomicrobiae bacterium]
MANFKSRRPSAPGWRLVWEDDFEGDAIDPKRWRIEDAALVKNDELQYYCPEEVILGGSCVTLRSRRRVKGGRPYTSGLIESRDRFSQEYGRFEVRAQLPRGQGLWPAHWMLPSNGDWPPEIDIMESLGHAPRTVLMTVHWRSARGPRHHTERFRGPDYSRGFHTFEIEWGPRELIWRIDGVERFRKRERVPRSPFYLILNTAVGGMLPGNPNGSTRFPQYHRIDWVRVWKRV